MAKPNPRRANGYRRNEIRKRWRAIGDPCAICGKPIDYTLPAGHPMSFEVDEIIPVSLGGNPLDFSNTRPAHRICNQRRGNGIKRTNGKKRANTVVLPLSRQW